MVPVWMLRELHATSNTGGEILFSELEKQIVRPIWKVVLRLHTQTYIKYWSRVSFDYFKGRASNNL